MTPTVVPDVVAQLLSAAALVAGAVTLLTTRRPALALAVFLDLLTAAGLVRLAGNPTWQSTATAASIVALRHLIGYGLRTGARSWSAPSGPRATPRLVTWSRHRLLRPAWRR